MGRKEKATIEVLEPDIAPTADVEVDRRQIMSQEEAIARTIAMLAARAYSDEQLRLIQSAKVVGVADFSEIEQALAKLPPEQLQQLMLTMSKNPSMLEDESLANLASKLSSSMLLFEPLPEPVQREEPKS